MAALLGKNFSLCFSIIKRPPLPHPTAAASSSEDLLHPSSATTFSDQSDSDSSDDYDKINAAATPDIATVYASHRFFFSSPGRSNSIVDSSSVASSSTLSEEEEGVAVETYSDDPYGDFRRSMVEMVEARGLHVDVGESWKSLQELLLCYLSLNPKHTHKFIVAAFSDLLLSLLHPPPGIPVSGQRRFL